MITNYTNLLRQTKYFITLKKEEKNAKQFAKICKKKIANKIFESDLIIKHQYLIM